MAEAYHRVGVLCQLQESRFLNNLVDNISLLTDELFTQLVQCVPHSQYHHGYRHLITFGPFIHCIRSERNHFNYSDFVIVIFSITTFSLVSVNANPTKIMPAVGVCELYKPSLSQLLLFYLVPTTVSVSIIIVTSIYLHYKIIKSNRLFHSEYQHSISFKRFSIKFYMSGRKSVLLF